MNDASQRYIDIVINAYKCFHEQIDLNKIPLYIHKDFVFYKNDESYTYNDLMPRFIEEHKKYKEVKFTPFLDIFAAGNKVAVRYTMHAKSVENNQPYQSSAIVIFEFQDDKIIRIWELASTSDKIQWAK